MALLKQIETRLTESKSMNPDSAAILKNNKRVKLNHSVSILSQLNDSQKQAKNVMSDLSQLSQAFVDSFQNIEVKVEALNGQLNDAENKHLIEKNAKIKLQSENDKINNRLNNLLDILPSGVVLLDHKGFVCDCNRAAIDMLGRPLLGEIWIKVIERAFSPQADDGHQVSLIDGRKIHIETTGLSPEPGQLIVLTDLTKTRQLQDQLSQNNKLSSMGKMIASLAHQIRTPLSAAMIYGSHINDSNLDKKQVKKFSENLMERLKFMDRQIHDMLKFVRGERKQKKSINVEKLLCDLKLNLVMLERVSFSDSIEELNNYYLLGNSDDLIGAISNLAENAIAASKLDQSIEIKLTILFENNQRKLIVEVADRGKGMSHTQKNKIFEPFYTTKNNGNGLGLAIVRGVIIEHGGTIEVESSKGIGSVFKINLPLSQKAILRNGNSKKLTDEVVANG